MVGVATLKRTEGGQVAVAARGEVLLPLARAAAGAGDLAGLLLPAAPLLRRAVDADRCTVLVVDDDGLTLRPVWADARTPDPEAWRRLRALPPVRLDEVPARARLFRLGRVLAVADLARSSLAPPGVAASFGAHAALLVPLQVDATPVGLVVLDWAKPGRPLAAEDHAFVAELGAVLAPALARVKAAAAPAPAPPSPAAAPSAAPAPAAPATAAPPGAAPSAAPAPAAPATAAPPGAAPSAAPAAAPATPAAAPATPTPDAPAPAAPPPDDGPLPPAAHAVARVALLTARFQQAADIPAVLDVLDEALAHLVGARLHAVDVAPSGAVADTTLRWRSQQQQQEHEQEHPTPTPPSPTPPPALPTSAHLARADEQGGGTVEPPVVQDSAGSTVLLPLTSGERPLGSVAVAPSDGCPLTADGLDAASALVALAGAAVARVADEEGVRMRLHHAEALYRLSDVVASTGDIDTALRELNRSLPKEFGITLSSICLSNAQMRAAVGADTPTDHELEAIRSWRSILAKGRSPLQARMVDGWLLVPVAHRSRVQGALRARLRRQRGPAVDELLLAIGAGCAEVVHRAALKEHLAESERRLVVATERERLAQDLHDSVAQIVTGMGMRLAQYVGDAPDKVWRARLEELLRMAARGNREIRAAIHALLFLDSTREGLPVSVRALVRKFEVTTGLPVRFILRGPPISLASAKEDALFRVAHEALLNVERHSRASLASVQLTYAGGVVSLAVRDDGVGLGHRDPFGMAGGHFGIRAMQQRLEAVGGELRVRNARPRGVVVEASVTKGTRGGDTRKRVAARGATNETGARGGHR